MEQQYLDPFEDKRRSCPVDFAVALILGRRRFDGKYLEYKVKAPPYIPATAQPKRKAARRLKKNSKNSPKTTSLDSINPNYIEEAYEYFLEWLDQPILQILQEEGDDIRMSMDAAIETKADIRAAFPGDKDFAIYFMQHIIDDCKTMLLEHNETAELARKYLRQIDDELANNVDPVPPRHNTCRLYRSKNPGVGDEGYTWHVTDRHSRTER